LCGPVWLFQADASLTDRFLFNSANGETSVSLEGGSTLKEVWKLFESLSGGEFRRALRAQLEKMKQEWRRKPGAILPPATYPFRPPSSA
jgi:hypothetical protein